MPDWNVGLQACPFVCVQFTRGCLDELERISERIIAVVCDGAGGRSASLLGLSDEYSHHSCRAYGATATVDRPSTSCCTSTASSPVTEVIMKPSSFASAAAAAVTYDTSTTAAPAAVDPAVTAAARQVAAAAVTAEVHIHNVTIDVLTSPGCVGGIGYDAGPHCGSVAPSRACVGERVGVTAAAILRKCLGARPVTSEGLCGMLMESSAGLDDPFPTGFHLKIFGDTERRCMALAVPRCESRVVRALNVVTDQSVSRSVFPLWQCFQV